MDFNNKIIICPNNLQKFFLTYRRNNPYENFSIYSLRELQQDKFGKVKDEAIKECLKNNNFSIKTLKEYFRYIESGVDETISDIVKDLKSFLLKNDLIEFDDLIDYKFTNKEVVVVGYSKDNLELAKLLKELKVSNVTYIHSEELRKLLDAKNNPTILEFKTIDEEIRYVLNVLMENFNNNGKKKCIFCDVSSYKPYLEQYVEKYQIKLYFDEQDSFANTKIGKDLLQIVESRENVLSYISTLKEKVEDETKEFLVRVEELIENNLVIKTENGHITNDIYDNFAYLLSTIKIAHPHYENEILVTSKISFDSNYEYYILGASDAFLPKLVKNNKIFDDSILEKFSLNTSIVSNIEAEVLAEAFVKSNFISHISYYSQKGKDKVYPTTLLDKHKTAQKLNYDYSLIVAGAYVSKAKDIERKYNELNFDLNYEDIASLPDRYDSSFKKDNFIRDDERVINLSYSSLNDLFECPFRYYISSILKIDTYESTFAGKLGTFVHAIFENIDKKPFDEAFDIAFNKLKLLDTMDAKELIFVQADKKKIKNAYDLIQKNLFNAYSIGGYGAERKVILDIKDKIKLEGRIDGYVTINPSNELVILDYKSGGFSVGKLDDYNEGRNLQVLIYCYLLSNYKETSGKKIAGAYYCPVLSSVLNENSPTYLESLKFQGISFSNILEASNLVKLSRGKFVLNNDLESCYKDIIEEKIDEAEEIIRNYCFTITPYDRTDACAYCRYKSICFKYFAKECLLLDEAKKEEENNDELE